MNRITVVSRNIRNFIRDIKLYLAKGYLVQDIDYKAGWVFVTYRATMVFNAPIIEFNMGPLLSKGVFKKESLMAIQLTDLQKVQLTAKTINAAGNKVPVDSPTWVSSDPTVVSVVVADGNALSATAVAVGPIGSAKITFSCLGIAGDENTLQIAELEISVVPSPLTLVVIEAGEPASK